MDDKEYIEALENTLIFMCGFHEDCARQFMYNPQTCAKFPVIQGMVNQVAIGQAAQLPFNPRPNHGIHGTLNELMRRRGVTTE